MHRIVITKPFTANELQQMKNSAFFANNLLLVFLKKRETR